jgi:phosphoribosylformylglycinamidine cyclo-ligase
VPITYREAGVDIDAGQRLVERLAPLARSTRRPEVIGGLGGFSGLCALPRMRDPVLCATTDGVGTKLKVAIETGRHDTVGVDLVAMCVNDLITCGAEPLFFLDYFACGRLEVDRAEQVIAGIAKGCREAGCALLGGETAEMPGMYGDGEYDLAGFAVGVVEREALIDGARITAGDRLVGLASSGLHSNGYSLARRVLPIDRFADELLRPTRIYVPAARALLSACEVRGMAHITGGGLQDNPPRMLPEGGGLRVELSYDWPVPAVFRAIQQAAGIDAAQMRRVFNMGVGLVVCVPAAQAGRAIDTARTAGEQAFEIGRIVT